MPAVVRTLRVATDVDFTLGARWSQDGVPFVLSSARLVVAKTQDGPIILDCTLGNGRMTVGSDGWARAFATKAYLATLTWPTTAGWWEMVVTRSADGLIERIFEGQAVFSRGLT